MNLTLNCAKNILALRLRSNALQYGAYGARYTSKIAVEIDEDLQSKLENDEMKPRHHPGIIKTKHCQLPPRIEKALQKVVGDHPVKAILKDARELNQYIKSRHPPPEKYAVQKKMREIIKQVNEKMPKEQLDSLDEESVEIWKKKRDKAANRILAERTYAWKPIKYGKYESIVYAVGRGAMEYAILQRIFKEIISRDDEFKPRSYFDFGSGVGTGMWAASNLWKESIFEYFNVDSSVEMNDLAELILSDGNENQQITLKNVFFRQFLPAMDTQYDLVVSSFSLFELPNLQSRMEVLLNLWRKCSQYLVLVESGTRRGSELIEEARNFLLHLEDEELAGHAFSPCPHDSPCPRIADANDDTPCNFEVSYAPVRMTSEKMKDQMKTRYSYVVLKKGPPNDPTRDWPRLVRPTLLRSGHVICRLCTKDAKLQEIIFTKSKHGKTAFRCAKASRWGDRMPITVGEPFDKKSRSENKQIKDEIEESSSESSNSKDEAIEINKT